MPKTKTAQSYTIEQVAISVDGSNQIQSYVVTANVLYDDTRIREEYDLWPVANPTQFQIQQQKYQHAKVTRLFREVIAVERTLIQQIVTSVDAKYLKALRDSVTNKISVSIP